jgi:7-cyano-7-deazaguanine synthase in queuosine biosynthesis
MPGAKEDQENSIQALDLYKNDFFHMPSVAIFPNTSREKTCRSRSFIFISMAALVAVYKNINIVVPENGSVSLNFPLSPSRRAACSTRTTHVLFINKLKGVYDALGQHVEIYNPYETKTKGQMVHNCNNRRLLLNTLDNTNSCGKRNAKQHMSDPSASHCGRCMPCMYRRASLVGLKDSTTYGDTFRQLYNDKGRRSDDFFAMLNYLRIDLTEDDIRKELRIAGLGLLPNIEEYVQLVKDTRAELKKMVSSAQDCDEVKRYLGLI